MRFTGIIFFLLLQTFVLRAQTMVAELPSFPATPLQDSQISALMAEDNPQAWAKFSDSSREKALDFALKQLYAESASWLYTHYAAKMFSQEGAALQPELKADILKNLPAFFDFYETLRPEDSLENACKVMSTVYGVYPIAAKKYLRSLFAVALIYDHLPPADWPNCNVPSNPAPISQPQEIFNVFMEEPNTFVMPFDRMTVGELIYVFGVAGPMDELRSLINPKITPYMIEKLTQSIKTDPDRVKGRQTLPWDSTRPYTVENIKKYGGLAVDKVYYAWRVANANGIPCLYFSELKGGKVYSWLWYMSRPGIWKEDIARDSEAKAFFGRPPNPQTWKSVSISDIAMLSKRYITTQFGVDSMLFNRLSKEFYDKNDYANAGFFADSAIKANPENWKAYGSQISAKARGGATSAELDTLWKRSYEVFRKYPDLCIDMLNDYRANLYLRRNQKEADRLFIAEMRIVMRQDPGFGIDMYSRQLSGLFENLEDKNEMMSIYQDVLRNCSNSQAECFRKIVTPLAQLFDGIGDRKSALRVVSIFESSLRADEAQIRNQVAALKEKYAPPRTKKEKEEEALRNL